APVPLDFEGRVRVDELEMGAAIQAEVESRMARVSPENLGLLADVDGFKGDFLRAHGFAVDGVDYEREVSPLSGEAPSPGD
ncbi:MAG: bifunctional NADH-specific enoyl-ACP reductase/trans-2-enoyl-CoA reductase, partial [Spirochaetaceae bacterium]|nr:bifunctional NADH-specific enoyl-ACP reductase/trans-2-enoyl-CoA reductase [Spirochaetaceae bacterium]